MTVNADAVLSAAITPGTYPLLPLSITPSIALYKQQQARFADFRQRFITATVTSYVLPTTAAASYGTTNEISQASAGVTTIAGTFSGQ